MANHKSAIKRIRQNEKRRIRNKGVRTLLRTRTNQFERAVSILSTLERAVATQYAKEFKNSVNADPRFAGLAEKFDEGAYTEIVETFETIAAESFRMVSSDLSRAASKGVIPSARASRKTGRLAVRLNAFNAQATEAKARFNA